DLKTDVQFSAIGKVQNNKLIVEIKGSNMPTTKRTYELKYPFHLPQSLWALALIRGDVPKEIDVYDPTNFVLGTAKIENLGTLEVEYNRSVVRANVYKIEMFGAKSKVYILDKKIIKIESPFDITLINEPKEIVMEMPPERLDVTLMFAIKPNGYFDPEKDSVIILELENLRGNLVLELGPQKLIERDSLKAKIEIRKQKLNGLTKDSIIPDSVKEYLKSDEFVQSDHPRIKKLADEITKDKKTNLEKAQAIMNWVYSNLKKKPTVSVPNAIEVLDMGYGDCNEHSVLYTALARAAGIPTDIIVGLIYQDGKYFYHAWTASYIDGVWIWIDPVFGQFPASIGHLMLQRGSIDKQAEIMGIVGKLNIKVLKIN
ncbi:MAG: transglutaminase-like domain-containing protein, partial [candidate division WOR-3 bacterium]